MSNTFGSVNLINSGFQVSVAATGLTETYSLSLPIDSPADGEVLTWNDSLSRFVWGAAGSTIDLSLSLPDDVFNVTGSPYSGGTGSFTVSFDSQNANLFFASPNGAGGVPSFRAMVDADLPAQISASKISGTLAKATIPGGTLATTFQIENSGVILANNNESLSVYDSTGIALSDIYCRKLIVTEGIDQDTVTTVNLGDAILKLVSDLDGASAPTTDAGFDVTRGNQPNAILQWKEASDDWQAGVVGNVKPISRFVEVAITNADLVGNNYTLNHNLGTQYPDVWVIDDTNRRIGVNVNYTGASSCVVDFTHLAPLSNTWRVVASGK